MRNISRYAHLIMKSEFESYTVVDMVFNKY